MHEVRFTATPSPLDYAQFRMQRQSPIDGRHELVRLNLSGSGYLEMILGSSERVADNFWRESEAPAWQDIRRDHAFLTEAETTAVFQRLVDIGFFDRRQRKREHHPPHDMVIVAALGFRKQAMTTRHEHYRELFRLLQQRVERQ